jgi:hypothetical protein
MKRRRQNNQQNNLQNQNNQNQNNKNQNKKFNINALPDLNKKQIIKKVVESELMNTRRNPHGISYLLNHHEYNQILFYKEGKDIATRLIPKMPEHVKHLTIPEIKKEIHSTSPNYYIRSNIRKPDLLTIYSRAVTPYTQYFTLESFEKKYSDMYNSILLDTMKPLDYTPF